MRKLSRKTFRVKMRVRIEVRNFTRRKRYAHEIAKAVLAALKVLRVRGHAEVSVVLVSEGMMKAFNKKWRGIPRVTDVLSFGFWKGEDAVLRGELALCLPYAAKAARKENVPFARHVAFLAVHGVMHLAGIHHEGSQKASQRARAIQERIMRRIVN